MSDILSLYFGRNLFGLFPPQKIIRLCALHTGRAHPRVCQLARHAFIASGYYVSGPFTLLLVGTMCQVCTPTNASTSLILGLAAMHQAKVDCTAGLATEVPSRHAYYCNGTSHSLLPKLKSKGIWCWKPDMTEGVSLVSVLTLTTFTTQKWLHWYNVTQWATLHCKPKYVWSLFST